MAKIDMPMGGNVFWSAGSGTNRERLRQELAAIGLEDYTPCQRTEAAALKMALEEYADDMLADRRKRKGDNGEAVKRDKIVQALLSQKDDGFEVVDVTRKEKSNDYVCDFRAKIVKPSPDAEGVVEISYGYANQAKIQSAYEVYRATLGGTAIGGALVEIVKAMQGVSLKDSGGVYWLPPNKCERWEEIIRAFESAGDNKVYIMRTVMDLQTVRAVSDNIADEVLKANQDLQDEICSGKHGEKAVLNRLEKARGLHKRVRDYENILGKTMQGLHDALLVAETASASAVAIQETESVFDGLFAEV